jgi:O-glycosyl hydrolase
MTSRRILSLVCASALAAASFVVGGASAPSPAVAADAVRITPNPGYASDPFEGWGTSLVWFANATGGYPADVRQKLFDAVFGEEGLNLNIARYNIGGGNATDVPGYLRPGGAVPGWWNPDLGASDASGEITSTYADRDRYAAAWDPDDPASYDFDADAGQRWWLDALKDRITHWEAFSNSPPYFLTESGYVSGGINNATSEQLAPENMDAFASYLVTVVEELEKEHGIEFDTLDPFNEPNTNYWSTRIPDGATWPTSASRQEGAHIGPAAQDAMVQALRDRLEREGASTEVKISAMDETNPGTFVRNWNGWSDESKDAVDQLNVHTYGTGDRQIVRDIAKASDKPLWMSEVEGDWDGTGFNLVNIENGLGMASHITDDLRELEPEAWVFWQPVEDLYNMEKVEKLNWGSVFIDFDCNAQGQSERRIADGDADPSCQVLTNAKYNTVRNFTHYIRPGDRLIPTENTQTTAALSASGEGATLVHVNDGVDARTLQLDLSKFGAIAPGATVTPVVTTQSPASDPTQNALVAGEPVAIDAATASATITVPAKSVTTLVVSGVSGESADAAPFADGETYQLLGVQSGKALTASAGALSIRSTAADTAVARGQAWTVESLGGEGTNRHRIALRTADGAYLAVSGTSTAVVSGEGASPASDPRLQWIPSTTDGRTFSLLSVEAERVLDVDGAGSADGTAVGTWTSNGGTNQSWTLASTAIESVAPVAVSTPPGVAPTLPETVAVRYRGGVERPAAVEWNTSAIDWSATGEVEVAGSGVDVFGAPFEATATVEVGEFTAVQPTSITTYAGAGLARVRAAAPITAPAEVRAGGPAYETPVTWDWSGVADASFAETGTVSVPGTVAIEGGTLPATLAVIVTEATERNVAPDSAASATFTESPSYGVERTINGVTGDKGWSNWRSGTKNTTDTLSYDLAERTQVRHASVQFYRDGGATWPQRLRVEHRLTGGEWSTGSWVDVPAQDAGAPLIDVPLGDVDADEVRVVMEARPATHIVVSEVQIFGLRPSASSVSDLARLTVDGEPVAGFAADTTEYRVVVEGTGWPRLAAIAVDRDAAVRITQPDAGDGTGTVTVTAPDGSERTYTVTIERAGTGPQPSPEPSGPGASPSPSIVPSTSPSTVPNAGGPAASGTGSGALAATGADASIWVAPALLGAAVAAAGVVLFVRRRPRGTAE